MRCSLQPAMTAKAAFIVSLLIYYSGKIRCDCNTSYVVFCDCVTDLQNYKPANWTDVIIDSNKQTCSSRTIDSNSFEALEEINLLFVVNSADDIRENSFGAVGKSLKVLKFYGNTLTDVKSRMFSGFSELSRLELINNGIQFIEGLSFVDSTIKNLDLSNNQLETIPEDVFRGGKITSISIKHNKLTYINDDAFDEHLKVLKLDYNNLEYIQRGFIAKLPNLKKLTISHNKLSQMSDIRTLENLKTFDLSFNDINIIDSAEFEDLKQLVYLDLSGNKLETISLATFKKNKADRMILLLSYNQLTNVEIPDNPKPMTITYFGNPWNCKCLVKMEQKLIQYNFSTTKCNLQLFRSGVFPICVEQGECKSEPVEIRPDLRRFTKAVKAREHLPCDLFQEVKTKHIVNITSA